MVTAETASVWTLEDQARLDELTERRDRILSGKRTALKGLLMRSSWHAELEASALASDLIAIAGPLRDALEPFDGRRK